MTLRHAVWIILVAIILSLNILKIIRLNVR